MCLDNFLLLLPFAPRISSCQSRRIASDSEITNGKFRDIRSSAETFKKNFKIEKKIMIIFEKSSRLV